MKAILFCLLNFFIFFSAQAQTYHSFMHDTAVWNETDATNCCDPAYNVYYGFVLKYIMIGDTNINGYQYKKIYRQVYDIDAYNASLGCGNWYGAFFDLYLSGFIREDSSKKIYFLGYPTNPPVPNCAPLPQDSEVILYDFNLQVGDTVQWKPYNNVVVEIDSVLAPTGDFLKRIKFDYQQDFWIEGLGSTIAFFGSYMPPPFECGCALTCAEATDLLPPNSLPPCGGIVNAVINLHTEIRLKISPNPFSDFVSLTSPFQSLSLLSVMNSQGQTILKKRLQPLEKISFTKNELPVDDFIFFRLISDEGVSQSAIAVHMN